MTFWDKPVCLPSVLTGYQHGASLVEVMVALVLSLILVAGVGQIYLGSKQTYRMQDGQSRMQENARTALDILTRDIRAAGYFGCQSNITWCQNSDTPIGHVRLSAQWCQFLPFSIGNGPLLAPNLVTPVISGGDNASGQPARFDPPNPALSSALVNGVVSGTDAITLLFGQSCAAVTTASMTSVDPDTANAINNTCNWTVGTPLIIADCQTAHIFRDAADNSQNTDPNGAATALLATPNPTLPAKTYDPGSAILLYRAYTYYIRFNPGNEPALYRFDNNRVPGADNPVELVEGVENMQIEYGIDSDNDGSADLFTGGPANGFQAVVAADQWVFVKSVRVYLTVRSVGEGADNLSNELRTYSFDEPPDQRTHQDRRLAKQFTATINLRNGTR